MSKDLKAYMVSLAIDPQQLSDFIANPGKAAEQAGLSPENRAALLSGDQERIFAALMGRLETKKDEAGTKASTLPPSPASNRVEAPPWPAVWQPAIYPPLRPSFPAVPCPSWGQPWWMRRG